MLSLFRSPRSIARDTVEELERLNSAIEEVLAGGAGGHYDVNVRADISALYTFSLQLMRAVAGKPGCDGMMERARRLYEASRGYSQRIGAKMRPR